MFYGILRDLVESTTTATQAATAAAETTEDVTISVEEIVEQVTNDPVTFFDGVLQWLKSIAGNLVGAALIIIIGFWVSKKIVKIIKKGMLKAKNDYTVITFIGSVVKTYVIPDILNYEGKLDDTRLKLVLFEFPTYCAL